MVSQPLRMRPRESFTVASPAPHHSALADWTVQTVGMLPSPADDATVAPFMNQIAVLPLLSRQSRSLMPSPLKSPVSATDHVVGTLPTPPVEETVAPFMNQIDVLPLLSRQRMSLLKVAAGRGDRKFGDHAVGRDA